MIAHVEALQQLLTDIDAKGSEAERKAASDICGQYHEKTSVQLSGDRLFQWQRCALASSSRTPEAIAILKAHARYSQFEDVRRMAAEELRSPQYAALGGRRLMPSEAVADI